MTNRNTQKGSAEKTVRDIRRATRKRYSAEEKIRIVLEGLRGEVGIAIYVATLDHPEDFAPSSHTGTESQMPWLDIHDGLPRRRIVDSTNTRKRWETAGIPNPAD